MASLAIPDAAESFAGASFASLRGVAVRPRFVGDGLAVTEWRCREAAHSTSGAKQQPWHVLAFVHAGSFRLRCPRGHGVADPTAAVLFHPGEPYETAHTVCCGDRGSAIAMTPEMAHDLTRQLHRRGQRDPWRQPLQSIDAATLSRQLDLLRRLSRGDPGQAGIEETLLDLAARVLSPEGPPPCPPTRGTRERVATAQEILDCRFREPLRLRDLAREVGLSPYHLCRQFRRHTGWTIHRYLTHLRIAESLERLAGGEASSLLDLALELGFDGHSHFSGVFRRLVGRPPSAFRGARWS